MDVVPSGGSMRIFEAFRDGVMERSTRSGPCIVTVYPLNCLIAQHRRARESSSSKANTAVMTDVVIRTISVNTLMAEKTSFVFRLIFRVHSCDHKLVHGVGSCECLSNSIGAAAKTTSCHCHEIIMWIVNFYHCCAIRTPSISRTDR